MTIVFFQRHPREKIVRESTKRYSLSINCYAAASKMSYYRRSRCSRSPSPYKRYSRSVSRSLSSDSSDVENPGNNLYVTGISARVTKRDLEKHFSAEGKVEDVHLVVDPWTRESRGFGFVTMSSFEEAERCIKYLDRSVLEGRVITVEKARRRRGRTPTPGRYLGLRTAHARRRSPSCSPYSRSRSPRYSSERDGSHSRSYSRYYRRRRRSCSPYYRSYSHGRSYSRSRSPYSRQDRSYSPYYYREYGPDDRYYSRGRYRDYYSPDDRYYRRGRYRSVTPPRYRRYSRSYSHSVSSRSVSPRYSRRDYSPSVSQSPMRRSSRKGLKRSASRGSESGKRAPSRASRRHSWSPSVSFSSRSG